jgi:hypothetical protein
MKKIILFITIVLCFCSSVLSQQLIPVRDTRTGLFGYKYDNNDKWVVKPKYEHAGYFSEGLAYVILCKGEHKEKGSVLCAKFRAGYINENGKIAIPLKFEWANDFHEGLAVVKVWDDTSIFHWRFGYIDKSGHFVLPPIYDYAEDFRNGRAKVKWYDGQGYCHGAFIDENGMYNQEWQEGGRLPIGQTIPKWVK